MGPLLSASCHCQKLKIFFNPKQKKIYQCNCSICQKKGFLHIILQKDEIKEIKGQEIALVYQFNTNTAEHYFCPKCGITPFYKPRSHPLGISVNARCLDNASLEDFEITPFDGQNWESSHKEQFQA